MGTEQGVAGPTDEQFTVRRYAPTDRKAVLDLDEKVWGRTRSESWFAWKYEDNPFVSETPVIVAHADGRIVGARPFMVFRLRIGDERLRALQPSDTMVHPDYRGRGIFTRMTEAALSRFEHGPYHLCFNFPNELSWPGYRKLGWRPVDDRTTYYRIQNPGALTAAKLDGRLSRAVGRAVTPAVRRILSVEDRSDTAADVTVHRERGVPTARLASLYRRSVPDRIHTVRDEAFYRWRLASPAWRRRTYLAERTGDPVAAMVARRRTTGDGVTIAQVAEVVPLHGPEEWRDAVARLLERVVADHAGADLLATHESPIPTDVLASVGFVPNDAAPLSWFTDHDVRFAVRPLGDPDADGWTRNGYRLTDATNWQFSFVDRDTS